MKEKIMEKCKVCGKELKTINKSHLKTHNMTIEEYEVYVDSDELEPFLDPLDLDDEIEELTEDEVKTITPTEITENIFKDSVNNTELLSDFLEEFNLTIQELRSIVRQHKTGAPLPIPQQIKKDENRGLSGAKRLEDETNVETHDLHIAEALTTKFGFVCTEVRSKPKKTWVLEKH